MSALGQKRTYAVQNGMSALPPIATSIASFGSRAQVPQNRAITGGPGRSARSAPPGNRGITGANRGRIWLRKKLQTGAPRNSDNYFGKIHCLTNWVGTCSDLGLQSAIYPGGPFTRPKAKFPSIVRMLSG